MTGSTSLQSATGRRRLIHPAAILPGLVLASGVAAFSTFGAFIPDYSRSVGLATSGGLFAVYSLVSLLVRVFGAPLPERLGPRRAVTFALSTVLLALLILALVPTVPALWAAAALVGVGMALNYPSLFALTVNKANDRDRAMGDQLVHDVLRGRFGRRRADRSARSRRSSASRPGSSVASSAASSDCGSCDSSSCPPGPPTRTRSSSRHRSHYIPVAGD